jgi:hypothetical protein
VNDKHLTCLQFTFRLSLSIEARFSLAAAFICS